MTARVVRGGFSSPTLKLKITPENWENAVQASSGGCLIADAIKKQYPHLSSVRVDMAQIRVSDTKKGLRYLYLTPEPAQTLLLSFDQGWDQPVEEIKIARAVKTTVIVARGGSETKERQERFALLLEKESSGEELTSSEKSSLTRMKRTRERPTKTGKTKAGSNNVLHGGRQPKLGPDNPNLLRGRARLYGAKSARPAEVFVQAVDKAVEERLASLSEES